MIERQRQSLFGKRTARRTAPPQESIHVLPDRTVPGIPPPRVVAADEPTILGFPAEEDGDDEPSADPDATVLRSADRQPEPAPGLALVAVPRADPLAGIALVLAGVAALVSLWLPWAPDGTDTGASLTRQGLALAGSGLHGLSRTDLWPPPVIVLGGVLLLLLGVLLFLPARTHRVVGVLALVVTAAVSAGVLVEVGEAGWIAAQLGPGRWFAVAVAVLGLLGALKAMLTVPRVTVKQARVVRR
jgi:hypothetical protein